MMKCYFYLFFALLISSLSLSAVRSEIASGQDGTMFIQSLTVNDFVSQGYSFSDLKQLVDELSNFEFKDQAAFFDLSSVIYGSLTDLSSSAMTIELWFASAKPEAALFGVKEPTAAFPALLLLSRPHLLTVYVAGGQINPVFLDRNLHTGDWHHLAVVVTAAAGVQTVLVDGVEQPLVPSAFTETSFPEQAEFVVGQSLKGEGSLAGFEARFALVGAVDEVRLWRRARSPAEIRAGYLTPLSGEEEDLALYLPFTDGALDTFFGSASSVSNGVDVDWKELKGPARPQSCRFRRPGKCFLPLFDRGSLTTPELSQQKLIVSALQGSSALYTLPERVLFFPPYHSCQRLLSDTLTLFPSTAFTLELWLWLDEIPYGATTQFPFSYAAKSSGNANDLLLQISSSNFIIYINSETEFFSYASPFKQWFHIAVSWSSADGMVTLYINGQAQASSSKPISPGTPLIPAGGLVLGADQDGVLSGYEYKQTFAGSMREVRLWNTVRTAAEIAAAYNQTLPASATGSSTLAGYWPLDEGAGDTLRDLSLQGNHLTRTTHSKLFGAPSWAACIPSASATLGTCRLDETLTI
eukprot:GCRY01002646.1.p1 GENE.GCRY01002646.1~~GCRY01002646.1.p1  ORF type:complete len:581 (+),score=143.01 GCRY01002646.1:162-1904(+)